MSVAVGFMCLEIRGETQITQINLGVISLWTEFKSMEMNEITRIMSVEREEEEPARVEKEQGVG